MAVDVVAIALGFIAAYGLVAILVLLVLDGAMLLPVFPGEVVLVMAVAAYAHDLPSLLFLIAVTTAAGLAGSLLLYGIMRGGGRRLVERHPRLFMMPRRRRERLEQSFQRPLGQSLVLFLRLVPLTRILVNIPAGLARMPLVRFVVLTALGLLAYHAAFLYFAYEVQRPGSALASQREQFQQAYASPAMDFVEANVVLTVLAGLAIGAVLSIRASRTVLRDPEESGSFVGWLSTMALLWGGMALGILTYLQPAFILEAAAQGGVDVAMLAARLRLSVYEFLSVVAVLLVVAGAGVHALHLKAVDRRKRFEERERQRRRQGEFAAALAAAPASPRRERLRRRVLRDPRSR